MIENKLINALKARQQEIKDGLVECPAEDLAKYNRLVGTYHGLDEALDKLHELLHEDSEG